MKSRLPWIIALAAVGFSGLLFLYTRSELRRIEALAGLRDASTSTTVIQPLGQLEGAVAEPPQLASTPTSPPSPSAGSGIQLAGMTTDPNGIAIPNATVSAIVRDPTNQSRRRYTTRTDAKGRFAFTFHEAGLVELLQAEREGYAPTELVNLPLPNENIRLVLPKLATIEIQIFQTVEGASQLARYSGPAQIYVLKRVSNDAEPEPSAPREVTAFPGQFVTIGAEQANVRDGMYRMRGFAGGIYKVAVVAGEDYAESGPFKLETNEGSTCIVVLGTRQKFAGTVLSQSTKGPIPGAVVQLTMTSRPASAGPIQPYQTVTDNTGRFEFDRVIPGVYALTIAADGYTTKVVEEIQVSGETAPTADTYYLVEGTPKLQIRVLNAKDKPVSEAAMVLLSVGGPRQKTFFGKSSSEGIAVFDDLPAGKYLLTVSLPENPARQKQLEFVVEEGKNQTVEVRFDVTVRVVGLAKYQGAPYQGLLAIVPRGRLAPKTFAKTDQSGIFQVELEPGDYTVSRAEETAGTLIKVPQLDTVNLEVELK
ncbi:MAG: carboxypeptidase regulatory-like domain-containing protein [Candidatus Hydrogenedentota bacterium]|jgi:hypothetical protein|nr:MAG: carboxypeptidase regulatory-like domain-containing protein [Candidatus Hydrogenedentota bacterium]